MLSVISTLVGAAAWFMFGFIPIIDLYTVNTGMWYMAIIWWTGTLAAYIPALLLLNTIKPPEMDNESRFGMNMVALLFSWGGFIMIFVVWVMCFAEEREEKKQAFEDKLMGR